jgi:hypothetical protein
MSESNNYRKLSELSIAVIFLVLGAAVTSNACSGKVTPGASPPSDNDILTNNIFDSCYIPSPFETESKALKNR